MKLHYFFLIATFLVITHRSAAQSTPFKWGKLSEKEKTITSTELDTAANAIILGEYAHILVDFSTITIETHVRVKVLNSNGFDEADIRLPYYFKDQIERIGNVKAQTLNVQANGKIEKTTLDNDKIFTVDIDDRWKATTFTFPAVKEGSILEYKYRKISKNYYYLDEWSFQKHLPVLYSELKISYPDVLEYTSYMQGYRLIEKYTGNPTNRFALSNLPPIKAQKFIYNMDDYAEKISFQLVSYMKRGAPLESAQRTTVLENWESLSKEVMEDAEFISFKKADKHYDEVVAELNLAGKPPLEKLEIAYEYVASNYRWNGKNSIFAIQKLKDFVDSKTGNTAELNLYLVNLLKTADIDANPMLISTRSNGMVTKKYALLSQFNKMITYAALPNGSFAMNPVNPYRSYKLPALSDYVDDGFVLREGSSAWVTITPDHKSRSLYLVDVDFDEDGYATHDVSAQLHGYDALAYRSGIGKSGNDYLFHRLKNQNITRGDTITMEQLNENSKPLKVTYRFTANQSSMVNKEMLYFDPYIFDEYQSNPFNEERRFYPIELPYESNFKMVMNMHIPEGFEVVGMPRSEKFALPNDAGDFTYRTRFANEAIQINLQIHFKKRLLKENYNSYLKEFYDVLIEKISEQIVMKKIASN